MRSSIKNTTICLAILTCLLVLSQTAFAISLGGIADNLLSPTRGITQLMYGVSYVAGAGMIIMALMQYKAHRDNPSQVRLGTPLAFFIFGLVFLVIPLVSAHSSSSQYVSATEKAERDQANAPLEYGKKTRTQRQEQPVSRPRQPTQPRQLAPVPTSPQAPPPQDSDWYQ